MWKKIDVGLIENPPHFLESSDRCYYAREFTSGASYEHSDTNQLVKNFKIKVEHRGTPRWRHKERAIKRFADEATDILTGLHARFALAPIPSSKRRDDAQYDDRLDAVVSAVCRACPHAVSATPITREQSIRAAHESGKSRPTRAEIRATLGWSGLPANIDLLVMLDDVVTTGGTFKECQSLVETNSPGVSVIGLFWARTVWEQTPDPEPLF